MCRLMSEAIELGFSSQAFLPHLSKLADELLLPGVENGVKMAILNVCELILSKDEAAAQSLLPQTVSFVLIKSLDQEAKAQGIICRLGILTETCTIRC